MKRRKVKCLVLLSFWLISVVSPTVISLAQGKVRGVQHDGYISFQGIPYATVGLQERFKRAGLAPTWLDVRQPQRSTCALSSPASDCLQLDVHMPSATDSLLPVLVWVKGGSGQYHPRKLVQQGIVVVVADHRIGAEGFLCTDDQRIPGNAGVKDVVLALRWVRDNIIGFRGNPAQVVVGGQSFGAAMVEALTLSQMTHENLYRGIILQSGSVLCPWAFHYDARERTNALGMLLGREDDIITSLLRATTVTLLSKAIAMNYSYFPFGMCVEKSFKTEERFMADTPYSLLKKGKVKDIPMLVGFNSGEANIFLPALKRVVKKISLDAGILLPDELSNLSKQETQHILNDINKLYFNSNNRSWSYMAALLAYHRDAYFLNHIHRSVRLHASSSALPVYYYQFSFSGDKGVEADPDVGKAGATHSDELAYLFPDKDYDYDGLEGAVQKFIVNLWANFIKILEPSPSWQPVDPRAPRIFDITTEGEMKDFPYNAEMDFWDHVYEKYYY